MMSSILQLNRATFINVVAGKWNSGWVGGGALAMLGNQDLESLKLHAALTGGAAGVRREDAR